MNGISDSIVLAALSAALHLAIQWLLIIRVLLKPHRDPRARLTWVVVIIALPIGGIITYLLFGETNIGRKRAERMRTVMAQAPTLQATPGANASNLVPQIPECYQHLFQVGHTISGFQPVGDNHAQILQDSNAAIEALVADIDAAQVIGTGPTVRYSAMPELLEALIYSARRSLVITTPYYVPDEPLQAALCANARRGVETLIIFPQRNDSRIVAAASRSYYAELLNAGVQIYEYVGGLLHTKSLTIDGEISLIGSANMDRRSFELNYENNILVYDPDLAQQIRQRQQHYLDSSVRVAPNDVANWPRSRQLINNITAMLGPIL
ncbi:phospholipase D-like domain-containing protein [Vreelandella olivaria]|uniref:phospholipase D-like domain-containing protein n=1 Tax=Vreelandella olivaria TaxID=390919 RepID=UPI00201F184A|nr:phospholipase D-like domain-containing protein [Halomonas olivaria]